MNWDAVNVRAKGLATHLLDRRAMVAAAANRSWVGVARSLVAAGYPLSDTGLVTAADLALAVGRIAAARLNLLGRWLDRRSAVLDLLFADEDRRTIRTLLRGAAQGASPTARLRLVIPTPTLPERALGQLARAESPEALAHQLRRLGHPAGRALDRDALGSAEGPGLLIREAALNRLAAVRMSRAAHRAGRWARAFVARLIDLENAWSLLVAPTWGQELAPSVVFVPGGAVLDAAQFAALAERRDRHRIEEGLAERFAGTPFGRVFPSHPGPARLERDALEAELAFERREARLAPLGAAVCLYVCQRIRAEARDLRAIIAGVELGAPPAIIGTEPVTG